MTLCINKIALIVFILLCFNLIHRVEAQSIDTLPQYWLNQADEFGNQEEFDSAIFCLKKAAYYAEKTTQWEQLASSHLDQGLYFMYQEEFDSAHFYYTYCLMLAQKHFSKDKEVWQHAHYLQGVNYYYLGNYNQALFHANESLQYEIKQGGDTLDFAMSFENIGTIYQEKAAYDKALEYFHQAVSFYKTQNNADLLLGVTFLNMGISYNRKKDNHQAIDYYKKAQSCFENSPKIPASQKISLYNNWSIAYRDLGQLKAAMTTIQKALTLQNTMPYKKEVTLITLGHLYLRQGAYADAIKVLQEALSLYKNRTHPDVAKAYLRLGQSWTAQGNLKQALEAYQKGMAVITEEFKPTATNNPSIEGHLALPNQLIKLLHAKAQLLKQMGNKVLSLETYRLAAQLVSKLQQEVPLASTQLFLAEITMPLHEEGFEIAWEQYQKTQRKEDLNAAFFFAERTKSKLLLENLTISDAKQIGGVPIALIREEQGLVRDIAFYKQKWFEHAAGEQARQQERDQQYIFELDLKLKKLRQRIEEDYPSYHLHQKITLNITIEQLQKEVLASDKEVLIEYFVCKKELYAFVIQKTHAALIKLVAIETLDAPIKLFWHSIQNPHTATYAAQEAFEKYTESAYALYKLLLKPLIPEPATTLHLVQDERLSFLPMAAMLKRQPSSKTLNYLDLDYLMQSYTIGYSYSAALLWYHVQEQPKTYNRTFLGLAPYGELMQEDSLDALPFSVQEVEHIAGLLGGMTKINEAATVSLLETAGQASIVHIASHGVLNTEHPAHSYLAFQHKEHWHAFDIQNTPIQSNLVVLSACETGVGKLIQGEGILSLARSFLYAGSPSVLMTLWRIRDQSTALLMQHYYQHLAAGYSKTEALQQAQSDYLNLDADAKTAHPYFWAAQIPLGNPAALPLSSSRMGLMHWGLLIVGGGLLIVGMGLFRKKEKPHV